MNDEDSEQISLFLENMGYTHTSEASEADVILLNTCAVRQKPEDKVYSKLGELRELKLVKSDVIIGVCGCMAQVEAAQIRKRAPFVDFVMGTGNIAVVPDVIRDVLLKRTETGTQSNRLKSNTVFALDLPPRKGNIVTDIPLRNVIRRAKLKAHVPIMYGCDKFCTFCIVPFTRGRERSRPTSDILAEIEALARGGTREVTLLGQTVNSYGKNLAEGRVPFARLLERINDIPGIQRIRFVSPYPRDFTDDLIEAMAHLPKVCEHVHLPIQVADNELLARMHRGYTVEQYREVVRKLRSAMPDIAITTDFMIGFPGETDEQFENTMRFVDEIRFDAAFMFAYSTRPGTKATDMQNQIPHDVKVERLNRLIAVQNSISNEINTSLNGSVFEVLVEGPSPKNTEILTGLTRNFKTVNFTGSRRLIGKLMKIRTTSAQMTGFTGEVLEQ